MKRLKESVDAMTTSSVESSVMRLLEYTSRPLSDFNKFDALAMFETLANIAHDKKHAKDKFYKLALQTVRAKIDLPPGHFRGLLMRLIGDKDHEKVFDVLSKVEKSYDRDSRGDFRSPRGSYVTRRPRFMPGMTASAPRCFYCNRPGHFQAQCRKRQKDSLKSETESSTAKPGNIKKLA